MNNTERRPRSGSAGKGEGRSRRGSLSKKKNNTTASANKNKTNRSVKKPNYRLVPKHNAKLLDTYVSPQDPTGTDLEIFIRIYLYGADDTQADEVREVLAELFGKQNVHDIEYPFADSKFVEIYYGDFEQTPGVGIPRNKPISHVFRIGGQYGTPKYHSIHPGNHPENDKVLTQMEYKIGHAVQEKTNNHVVMFQRGTLGAYGQNIMLIGLQTP
jgi:hypothetical protein